MSFSAPCLVSLQTPVSCTDMATFFAVSAALGRFYFWTGARGYESLALLGDIVSLESPVEGPAYNWVNAEYLHFASALGLRHLVLPGHLVDSLAVAARNLGIQLLKRPPPVHHLSAAALLRLLVVLGHVQRRLQGAEAGGEGRGKAREGEGEVVPRGGLHTLHTVSRAPADSAGGAVRSGGYAVWQHGSRLGLGLGVKREQEETTTAHITDWHSSTIAPIRQYMS